MLNDGSAENIDLVAPPFWAVKKSPAVRGAGGQASVRFALTPPRDSVIREADLIVTLDVGGGRQGELYYRATVPE